MPQVSNLLKMSCRTPTPALFINLSDQYVLVVFQLLSVLCSRDNVIKLSILKNYCFIYCARANTTEVITQWRNSGSYFQIGIIIKKRTETLPESLKMFYLEESSFHGVCVFLLFIKCFKAVSLFLHGNSLGWLPSTSRRTKCTLATRF